MAKMDGRECAVLAKRKVTPSFMDAYWQMMIRFEDGSGSWVEESQLTDLPPLRSIRTIKGSTLPEDLRR